MIFRILLLINLISCVSGQKKMKVKPGDDVSLHCQGPRGADITLLKWKKPELKTDGYVFFFRERRSYVNIQDPSYRGRVELKDPEMKDGDVSVILKNVTINDTGTYECYVGITGSYLKVINTINLTVEPGDAAGNIWDEGHKDDGKKDGGNKTVNVAVVAGLSVAVLLLCVSGFIIFKKCQRPIFYQPPPQKAGEQHQV
ncbi:butyrophilin subfamily 2 member A1-like [Anabas testudineus]|uniref:butyrophilin subfamily 2 member A1-like n=1 Tax=Anabas testudineus TaxID=64144 RepID=UPI000E463DB1|nr:butyrophilin subfamily 2 member A1-like [Anabas testudineus]